MSKTESDDLMINFDHKKCIHARKCVLTLPSVFKPGTKGGWIFPENASAEAVMGMIDTCPSGALTYECKDGKSEALPEVNTAQLMENGPVALHGELTINEKPGVRAVLCRCGASKNKPYCDGSHHAEFVATSEPTSSDGKALEAQNGPVAVAPLKDGPLLVAGNLQIISGSGRKIATGTKQFLCRCGASKNKPFCDGAHKEIGFEAD